ncbi:AcrR family transcriptional regulator [Litorivivens lipolytica]|uniref:AcrR family transcriptional regulator n=1 Tax=Litorivivens lipolytica TaxID=1524264 RepID=A0A7W4Z8B4_9GAMM|nr:TetR/AcrR family transcriptional regulator [Litorivivens lipolytica]MBB3048796.1 AcrR family transcriptional regulator [Litorivivens lipolytica]
MTTDAPSKLGKQAQKTLIAREKILNAVISLINEGGFGAASSSKISRRSGLTWGAVQHHFGSKEDILAAILDQSHQRFTEMLDSDASTEGSLKKRVDEFVDRMWQHYQSDLYVATLEILLASRKNPLTAPDSKIKQQSSSHAHTMQAWFGDCQLSDDALLEALIYTHTFLTGLMIEQVFEGEIANEAAHLERIKRSMLLMLRGKRLLN